MTETKDARMAEAVLTDEMLKEMRSKIGLHLRYEHSLNNEEATRLAIRKFAWGIGDENPLWCDPEYAKKTRYGTVIAPPSWCWSTCGGLQFGFRGLGTFHSGSDMEFYKPVYLNDKIRPDPIFKGFDEPHESEYSTGKTFMQYVEFLYFNQRDEMVAKYLTWLFTFERGKAKEKGRDLGKGEKKMILPHPWTEAELKKVEDDVLSAEVRGSKPRYWEDVKIGEELKPVVKGPFGLTDMVAAIAGGISPVPRMAAHEVSLRQYRAHPAWAFRDPETYALEPVFSVHYNKYGARAMAQPLPYNVGIQSQCWVVHLLTNWMGDDGWLKKCYTQYRKFVYFSDVVWLKGKVTKKYVDDGGEYCVDIETSAINERGENALPGHATVALPSREKGISPLDSRLR